MNDELPVDARLCLAVHRASRAMDAVYRPLLEARDLTYAQYIVLSVLWEDGEQVVGALAQRLTLDASTLSPLLKRLEVRGLLTRRRDDDDQRRVLIDLTEAGEAMRPAMAGVGTALTAATGLSSVEQAGLVEQLNALTDHLGAYAEAHAVR